MKTSTTQKSASAWSAILTKLSSSSPGQIQIAYQDENGNKCVGYIDLCDIEITIKNKNIRLGDLFEELQAKNEELSKKIAKMDTLLNQTAQLTVKSAIAGGNEEI